VQNRITRPDCSNVLGQVEYTRPLPGWNFHTFIAFLSAPQNIGLVGFILIVHSNKACNRRRLMRGLSGKNVLVTGGASGIGQATAARFLQEGCAVCVLDRSAAARSRVAGEVPGLAGVIDADVSSMEQVQAAFAQAVDLMGSVDVLINNAGISIRHDFLDITPQEWNAVLDVNLKGVFYVAQTAARHMVDKGSGVIINTASTAGSTGYPHYADYSASKGGVIALTYRTPCWTRSTARFRWGGTRSPGK
jgi:NAD(P)-dependent dehydrogenase (short-subunit alcohol dehydrogenase family)